MVALTPHIIAVSMFLFSFSFLLCLPPNQNHPIAKACSLKGENKKNSGTGLPKPKITDLFILGVFESSVKIGQF